jgi:uncharacterized protein (DUF58 family)
VGAPVVRQFEQPRNRDVAVIVDLPQMTDPGRDEQQGVELAVSFAATVIADLCRRGGSDLLLATAEDVPRITQGPASAALMHDMMEQLAVVEGQTEDRLPALLETALSRVDPGAEIVLVSTRPVELSDTDRFGALWADASRRAALRRTRVIDTSDKDLETYYRTD